MGIVIGELAVHIFFVAGLHSHNALNEAADHAALFEFHIEAVGAAAFDGALVIAEHTAEAHNSHITHGGSPVAHWNQGGQLAAELIQQFIHPGWVIGHRFRFSAEPFGALQRWRGGHIHFQGDHQFLGGIEFLQQLLKVAAQGWLAQHFDFFLFDRITQHAVDQVFQRGRLDPKGADLLQQHRFGNAALTEARQAHAAAELVHSGLVGGLAAAGGNTHLQGQTAAGKAGGLDLESGGHRVGRSKPSQRS